MNIPQAKTRSGVKKPGGSVDKNVNMGADNDN